MSSIHPQYSLLSGTCCLQEKYFDTTKKLLSCEDEVIKLSSNVKHYEQSMAQLESQLQEERGCSQSLQAQVQALTDNEVALRRSEAELLSVKDQLNLRVQTLEKEMSQYQTELKLTQRVSTGS